MRHWPTHRQLPGRLESDRSGRGRRFGFGVAAAAAAAADGRHFRPRLWLRQLVLVDSVPAQAAGPDRRLLRLGFLTQLSHCLPNDILWPTLQVWNVVNELRLGVKKLTKSFRNRPFHMNALWMNSSFSYLESTTIKFVCDFMLWSSKGIEGYYCLSSKYFQKWLLKSLY